MSLKIGLSQESATSDLDSAFKGWPDRILYRGKPIDGFVDRELEPDFSEGVDSGEGETALILNTAVNIPNKAVVNYNGRDYKIRRREDDNGAWRYWLQEN